MSLGVFINLIIKSKYNLIFLSNEYLEKTIDIININNIIKKHTNKVEGNCLYRHKSNFYHLKRVIVMIIN